MDNLRIAQLVRKVQNGDNSAFDELYQLTSQRAYFVALEFTKNNQDAEDILQESYIKALSKIKELDKPESFSSWLNQIVANKSKDFLKKKKPMLFEAEENEVFEVIPDEDTSFSPEENLDQTELQKTVMEVLDELSEEKRACILMMYFEELSVCEIAETLEIPEGTVKTRLFSARKDLKSKFEKRGITSAFSFAPIGVVVWALVNASKVVQSPASAKILAGISVAGAGTAAGVTAGSGAATTAAVSSGTAAASTAASATGIGAKLAAMSVAQKVVAGVAAASIVTGSATATTVVVKNKLQSETKPAYVEEVTTAPDYGFENETLFIPPVSETESSTSVPQTSDKTTSANKTTPVSQTETSEKPTAENNTTTKRATTTVAAETTSKPHTTTTTKATTTKAETTTKKTTTAAATTKAVTTTKAATTTTTKATTTTTESSSPATVTVTIWGEETSTTKTLYFEAGEKITATEIENRLSSEYGIEAIADSINITAESGGSYTATAYE